MSRCFKNNSNLSAKEYTMKKGGNTTFCEARIKFLRSSFQPIGTNIVCVNEKGFMVKYNNYENLLKLKKELGNFRTDLSYFAGYGQQFKEKNCDIIPPKLSNDISNNYGTNVPLLTYANDNMTAQDNIVDSSGNYINRFAEIFSKTPSNEFDLDASGNFINKKQQLMFKCSIRENSGIGSGPSIVLPSEIEDINVHTIEIVFI